MKNRILPLTVFFILTGILSTYCHAGCTPIKSASSITIPNITFNRDMPAFSQIGSDIASTSGIQFNCDNASSNPVGDMGLKITGGTLVGNVNGRDIYSTNINGIGYAAGIVFTVPSSCPTTIAWVNGTNTGDGYVRNRLACTVSDIRNVSVTGKIYIALYKTQAFASTGTINIDQAVHGIMRVGGSWVGYESTLQANTFTNSALTCTVSNPASVSLPTMSTTAFRSINDTSGTIPFSLNINCPNQTTVGITFTDNNNKTQTGSILTASTGSSAKGIGMQLKYLNSIINFGADSSVQGNTNQITLSNNFSGAKSFPFTVSYIRTGAVTAGSLSTSATFTLSYQ